MRARLRRVLVVVLVFLVGLVVLGSTPAAAHPEDGEEHSAAADAAHAKEDLAGVPITTIERRTRARAAVIARLTGHKPGVRTASASTSGVERIAATAALDPGQGGSWSAVVPTEVVPVFQAVLPDGTVLIWDSVGENATETYPDQSFTRAMVWNPADDSYVRVDVQGANIFCAGYVQLANGNVLVAGGNKNQNLDGINQTHIFDWRSRTWTRGPDMVSGRWYPSVAALANGEALIVAGGPTTAEVYQVDNTIRSLTGFPSYGERLYPFLVPRPDGKVELVGPRTQMQTMDTAGAGAIVSARSRDGISRDYGSFATYGIGKTLVAGGGNRTEDGKTKVPTRTAVIVDTNAKTTVTKTGSMATGRRQFDLTVLADGTVLATGGESSAVDGLVDLDHAVFAAERWDPATGVWTVLSSASRVRQYHSTAALLPDGRVMTGGGGICGVCTTKGYLEKNIEYFTPPYLYKTDGSGQLADRPVITDAPEAVGFGQGFAVTTPQAASIKKLSLVRLGAPTHGDDQGQRYVPLSYSVSGDRLLTTAPANGGIAPPGYYMLFAVDSAGVPSVAAMVRVQATPAAGPIKGLGAHCVDIRNGATVDGTTVLMANCSAGNARQAWSDGPGDASLRVVNKCMDLSTATPASGSRVVINSCAGGSDPGQRWLRNGTDGTIRSATAPSLCLAVAGGSTAIGTRLELRTCSGSTSQKWSW